MELDQFLAQPPASVADNGFSQRVAMNLYRERARRRNWVLTACCGLGLIALAMLPLETLLQSIVWQLSAMAFSPFAPFVGGGVVLAWFIWQPRHKLC